MYMIMITTSYVHHMASDQDIVHNPLNITCTTHSCTHRADPRILGLPLLPHKLHLELQPCLYSQVKQPLRPASSSSSKYLSLHMVIMLDAEHRHRPLPPAGPVAHSSIPPETSIFDGYGKSLSIRLSWSLTPGRHLVKTHVQESLPQLTESFKNSL